MDKGMLKIGDTFYILYHGTIRQALVSQIIVEENGTRYGVKMQGNGGHLSLERRWMFTTIDELLADLKSKGLKQLEQEIRNR